MAGFVAKSNRNALWFGTEERMCWFPTPLRGASAGAVGWESGGSLLSGGGYQFNSFGSHREYVFEWSEASALQVADLLQAYASGSYGRGLIYFHDPLAYAVNVLPQQWADPSIAIGFEGASLVYNVYPSSVDTVSRGVNDLPVKSASYDLGSVDTGWRGKHDALFVPIPEGYALTLGAFYTATGSGGVFYRTQGVDGVLGAPVKLSGLSNGAGSVTNKVVSGAGLAGVWLYVGKSSNNNSSVTVSGMVARLIQDKNLTSVVHVTNKFTNPSFEKGTGTVEVARNKFTNPRLKVVGGAVAGVAGVYDPLTGNGFEVPFGYYATLSSPPAGGGTVIADGSGSVVVKDTSRTQIVNYFPNPRFLLEDGQGGVAGVTGGEFIEPGGGLFVPEGETAVIANSTLRTVLIEAGLEDQEVNGVPYEDPKIRVNLNSNIILGPGVWYGLGVFAQGYTGGLFDIADETIYIDDELYYIGWNSVQENQIVAYPIVEDPDLLNVSNFNNVMFLPGEWLRAGLFNANYIGQLFTGDNDSTDTFTYSWTGAVDGSASVQTATGISGVPTGYRDAGWASEGGFSLTLFDEHTVTNSANETVVVVARDSGQVLTTDEGSDTSGTANQVLRLNKSTFYTLSVGGWDLLTVVEGHDYEGNPFSGDSGTIRDGALRLDTSWTGAPDASTAVAKTKTDELDKAKTGPWVPGRGHTGVRMVGHPTMTLTSPLGGGQGGFAATFREVGHWLHG